MHETWCSTFIPLFNHFNNDDVGSAGIIFCHFDFIFIYLFWALLFPFYVFSLRSILFFDFFQVLVIPFEFLFLLARNFFVGSTSHFEWRKRIHRNTRAVTEKIVSKVECIFRVPHGGAKIRQRDFSIIISNLDPHWVPHICGRVLS